MPRATSEALRVETPELDQLIAEAVKNLTAEREKLAEQLASLDEQRAVLKASILKINRLVNVPLKPAEVVSKRKASATGAKRRSSPKQIAETLELFQRFDELSTKEIQEQLGYSKGNDVIADLRDDGIIRQTRYAKDSPSQRGLGRPYFTLVK